MFSYNVQNRYCDLSTPLLIRYLNLRYCIAVFGTVRALNFSHHSFQYYIVEIRAKSVDQIIGTNWQLQLY